MIKRYPAFFIVLFFLGAAISGCKLDAPIYPGQPGYKADTPPGGTSTTGTTGTTGTGTTGTGTTGTGTTGTGTTGTGTTGTGTTGTGTTGTGTTGIGTTGTGTTGTGTTGTGTTANDGTGLPIPTFIGVQVQIDGGAIIKYTASSSFLAVQAGTVIGGVTAPLSNTSILASDKLLSADPSDYFTLVYDDYRAGTYDIDQITVGTYGYSAPLTGPAAGVVKVTSLTATNIKGSFKVDLTDANGTVHPNAIGSFNVNK